MGNFPEFFSKRLENDVARRALRRVNEAMRNPTLRRLLSFSIIGKILNVVLLAIDKHKVLIN